MFIVYKETVVHKSEILLQIISLTRLRRPLLIKFIFNIIIPAMKFANNYTTAFKKKLDNDMFIPQTIILQIATKLILKLINKK